MYPLYYKIPVLGMSEYQWFHRQFQKLYISDLKTDGNYLFLDGFHNNTDEAYTREAFTDT